MVRVKLDRDALGLSSIVERITHAKVKDCFKEDGVLYVIVATGDVGKAIGKGGVNIHRLQEELGTKIKIIEYKDSVADFIRSIIYPLKIQDIAEDEAGILLRDSNRKAKSLLIGRDGKQLQVINRAVQRFFSKEVRVEQL